MKQPRGSGRTFTESKPCSVRGGVLARVSALFLDPHTLRLMLCSSLVESLALRPHLSGVSSCRAPYWWPQSFFHLLAPSWPSGTTLLIAKTLPCHARSYRLVFLIMIAYFYICVIRFCVSTIFGQCPRSVAASATDPSITGPSS